MKILDFELTFFLFWERGGRNPPFQKKNYAITRANGKRFSTF